MASQEDSLCAGLFHNHQVTLVFFFMFFTSISLHSVFKHCTLTLWLPVTLTETILKEQFTPKRRFRFYLFVSVSSETPLVFLWPHTISPNGFISALYYNAKVVYILDQTVHYTTVQYSMNALNFSKLPVTLKLFNSWIVVLRTFREAGKSKKKLKKVAFSTLKECWD